MSEQTRLVVAVPDELVDELAEQLAVRQRPLQPEVMTVPEVAKYLRFGKHGIYDLISQGRLAYVTDGSRVLVRRGDLVAYLEERA